MNTCSTVVDTGFGSAIVVCLTAVVMSLGITLGRKVGLIGGPLSVVCTVPSSSGKADGAVEWSVVAADEIGTERPAFVSGRGGSIPFCGRELLHGGSGDVEASAVSTQEMEVTISVTVGQSNVGGVDVGFETDEAFLGGTVSVGVGWPFGSASSMTIHV